MAELVDDRGGPGRFAKTPQNGRLRRRSTSPLAVRGGRTGRRLPNPHARPDAGARPGPPPPPTPPVSDEDDSWLEFDPNAPAIDEALCDALELDGHESEPEPGDFHW